MSVFSPLQPHCANFEYMLWFESLLFYGFEEHSTLQHGDGDVSLLPAIVEKVILAKLTGRRQHLARAVKQPWPMQNKSCVFINWLLCVSVLAEQMWDPLSSSQTARLVGFIHRLMKGYPTVLHGDNRYTQVQPRLSATYINMMCIKCGRIVLTFITFSFLHQELLRTIVFRTRRTLDEDVFLPLYPKKYVPLNYQHKSRSVFFSICRITYPKMCFAYDQCVGEQEQQPLLILPEAVLVLREGRKFSSWVLSHLRPRPFVLHN